jgi:predicted regulator of Ras-like GTPase activity (Roadblock/LC7/MglB family)
MGDVILFKEDVDQLNSLLKNLVDDAKILSALLVTKDTRVLACHGTVGSSDTGALAALLVGSFASTQAIAGLIGETEFDTMTHCGKTRNVVISLIDDDTILASVFDKSSTTDRIQASVAKHLEVLRRALHSIGGNTTHDLFDTGSTADAASEAGDEFELRADALHINSETDQPLPVTVNAHNPSPIKKPDRDIPEPVSSPRAERSHKAAPQTPSQGTAVHGEIPRPPDTEMIILSQTQQGELNVQDQTVAASLVVNPLDSDQSPRKREPQPESKEYEELIIGNKSARTSRAPAPAPDTQHNDGGSGSSEAFHMSMNYLKNKTREGALYYHHDKAFFKKFFKSSHKKKS